MTDPDVGLPVPVDRLIAATNAHDLEALVGCFSTSYRNETPAHPDRDFQGTDQVRANWSRIFDAVPDIRSEVVRWSADGSTIWLELAHHGTRRDGAPHEMRGVTILGLADERIQWVRFYLEPVRRDGADASAALAAGLGAADVRR